MSPMAHVKGRRGGGICCRLRCQASGGEQSLIHELRGRPGSCLLRTPIRRNERGELPESLRLRADGLAEGYCAEEREGGQALPHRFGWLRKGEALLCGHAACACARVRVRVHVRVYMRVSLCAWRLRPGHCSKGMLCACACFLRVLVCLYARACARVRVRVRVPVCMCARAGPCFCRLCGPRAGMHHVRISVIWVLPLT